MRLRLLPVVLLGACAAHEVTPAEPVAMVAPTASDSPYSVELLDGDGAAFQTFDASGRFYVLGESGERYQIHVTNASDLRVEAVVTVDGLDVIDGEEGDLRKRGYVVPPHGDLTIEGFRTSTEEVATFRFSSVDESYAGRKGKARNVGVIAVALFPEEPPPAPVEIVVPDEPEYTYDDRADYGGEAGGGGGGGMDKRSAGARRPPPDFDGDEAEEDVYQPQPDRPCCTHKTHRPGLGTEYGEQRHSAATWTRFVRSSDTPLAVTELRYNDRDGLAALGITAGPTSTPDGELTVRETADPYPGDPSFSRAP